ncbi:hypothetical protein Barb6XT_00599 [Bacteroidales bacterium Barb6XT]|nr:hypothetical protein Barb6XT_00599 [Bacteroidales bacterium Barb6XT]
MYLEGLVFRAAGRFLKISRATVYFIFEQIYKRVNLRMIYKIKAYCTLTK